MDRPLEPVFLPKGKNKDVFNVPNNLLTEKYKGRPEVQNRIDDGTIGRRINVKSNVALPNLSIPESLGKTEPFSLFIPRHKTIAGRLIDIFMGTNKLNEFYSCQIFFNEFSFRIEIG